jgi:pimeloyl-ACP methyl ester carboxylesterase
MTVIRTREINANGLSFAVDEAGDGDSVALLLHGFPESRLSWRGQLPALASLGWRAVAPDMRGYGQTSRPRGRAAYRMDRLTDDAAALFDALGARRRLLIGHDWGGLVAWSFAAARIRALDGLVILNAPHPAVYLEYLARSPGQWARSWYVAFFQLPWLPEAAMTARGAKAIAAAFAQTAAGRVAPEVIERHRANALVPGAMTAMINYYRANVLAVGGAPRAAQTPIAAPTLMIWGDRDPYLGEGLLPGHAKVATSLTVRQLPGVSHWVQQEASGEVNAILADWLSDHGLSPK